MTPRLATNYAKNCCNRTPIVKVIVENVVTCFFGDTVYIRENGDNGAKFDDNWRLDEAQMHKRQSS